MRLIIKFNLLKDCKYEEIGKHDIQGFYLFIIIYSLLKIQSSKTIIVLKVLNS